jgi:hypothetical protein
VAIAACIGANGRISLTTFDAYSVLEDQTVRFGSIRDVLNSEKL